MAAASNEEDDDGDDDFRTLRRMVDKAQKFGSVASLSQPLARRQHRRQNMSKPGEQCPVVMIDVFSDIVSTLITSLVATKTELTQLSRTGKTTIRSVRHIVREESNRNGDLYLNQDWRVFQNKSEEQFVVNIWTWNSRKHDWAYLMDPRCQSCYAVVADNSFRVKGSSRGEICCKCQACFHCRSCVDAGKRRQHHNGEECSTYQAEKRRGFMRKGAVPSFCVAVKCFAFGEGAERFAYKFRFVDEYGRFIGPQMVAKESRFVEDFEQNQQPETRQQYGNSRRAYHTQFVQTQAIAARLAESFNKTLDTLADKAPKSFRRHIHGYPRIRFLEPFVFELHDKGNEANLLVEPLIEGQYTKYNKNMGVVAEREDVKNRGEDEDFTQSRELLLGRNNLDAIAEEIGIDTDDDDSETRPCPENNVGAMDKDVSMEDLFLTDNDFRPTGLFDNVHDLDFPQAFSHFTYVKSKKNLLVVDLQGCLRISADDRREFVLTDPAIHKSRGSTNQRLRSMNFGRTDRGRPGIHAFFATHKCNDVCRMLGLSPETSKSGRSEAVTTVSTEDPDAGDIIHEAFFQKI